MSNYKYASNVRSAILMNPSFKAICDFNKQTFPDNGYALYYKELNRGTAIPKSNEECNAYLVCYGDKHYLKMYESLATLFSHIKSNDSIFEVFDWGGGQALASGVLLDFLNNNNLRHKVTSITLIDPSISNIERAKVHLELLTNIKGEIVRLNFLNKKCEDVKSYEISSNVSTTKIHLFSNILDMEINSKYVSELIKSNCKGLSYHLCVSPHGFSNLFQYSSYFQDKDIISQNINSFIGDVFVASSRKVVRATIFRNELIFKTK